MCKIKLIDFSKGEMITDLNKVIKVDNICLYNYPNSWEYLIQDEKPFIFLNCMFKNVIHYCYSIAIKDETQAQVFLISEKELNKYRNKT